MAQIMDYSAGYPGAINVQRLGFEGVIRYLRKEGDSSVRPITVAEAADMRAFGRTIALVYQHVTRDRTTHGRAAGRHDAQWALARAREVGIESPRAIYFAVDFDATPATVEEYFRGAADELGVAHVGAYGGYRVVANLFDKGLIRWGWQTVAWSSGKREARAHLFQRLGQITVGGISCDVNDVLKTDYGQHPAPASPEEDDDVKYFLARTSTDPTVWLTNGLIKLPVQDQSHLDNIIWTATHNAKGFDRPLLQLVSTEIFWIDDDRMFGIDVAALTRVDAGVADLQQRPAADVDESAVAANLAPLLLPHLGRIPDDQFAQFVDAVNDENDRRTAARAATPVPPA